MYTYRNQYIQELHECPNQHTQNICSPHKTNAKSRTHAAPVGFVKEFADRLSLCTQGLACISIPFSFPRPPLERDCTKSSSHGLAKHRVLRPNGHRWGPQRATSRECAVYTCGNTKWRGGGLCAFCKTFVKSDVRRRLPLLLLL